MKYHTMRIFGDKYIDGKRIAKQDFISLKQFEKWIASNKGTVLAMSFRNGSDICYKFRYENGKRRKMNIKISDNDRKFFYNIRRNYEACN